MTDRTRLLEDDEPATEYEEALGILEGHFSHRVLQGEDVEALKNEIRALADDLIAGLDFDLFMKKAIRQHGLLPEPEDEVDLGSYAEFKEQLDKILETLAPDEARVLRARFGLDDGRPHTLAEVGQMQGINPKRVEQIEKRALRKLRQPARAKLLNKFGVVDES